ncbi:MAG: right-handed parallel beta-helix repeat-containing protein [Candidatus Heimdallarchaeota archaeon]|nr:MAG: right-handed parallel beta-helix repeat-containing protein [Candidatus Heimdallarchaeota archaeon]
MGHKKHRMNHKTVFFILILIFVFINYSTLCFADNIYRDQNKKLTPSSDIKILVGSTTGSFIGGEKNDQVNLREFQPISEEKHTNTREKHSQHPIHKISSTQSYIERGPIIIASDFQLNNSGFQGNGTIDDPIRIEGYNITASSGTLISISDTTYHFHVANCLVNGLGTIGNGIYFDDVSHGTIVNNTIYDNSWNGILVSASENNTIESNTIYNSGGAGINIESGSNNCFIIRNQAYCNNGSGIAIEDADNNKIFNNSIHENDWNGIGLRESSNNFISNNSIHDHPYTGILLFSSSDNILSHNTVYNHGTRGIGVGEADSNNNTLYSNTIYNSGGSGILVSLSQVNLDIFNTIINNTCFNNSRNVSGSGISDYWTSGISLSNSSAIISNNTVIDNFDNGMLIYVSKNTVVSNNIIRNNGRHGISVTLANTTIVTNNEVFDNTNDGIHLFGSINNSVLNNSIYNNMITGISLSPFDDLGINRNSDNNTITRNDIYNNNIHGIELSLSENNSIINNTAYSNFWAGIWLWNSSYNNLIKNSVYNNKYGIWVEKSSNTIIIKNTVHATEIVDHNRHGILVDDSKHNSIENNSLTNKGIGFVGPNIKNYKQKIVANNSINGKPFIYWEDTNGGTVPQGAGQVFLFNCTNVLIADQTISNTYMGVSAVFCSHLTISNNTLHDNRWGINLHHYTNKTTLINNTGYNNRGDIFLYLTYDNMVCNNRVGNNSLYGITLEASENTTISNNIVFKTNLHGIHLWGAENNTIAQNIIFDNLKDGIITDELSKYNFVQFNDFSRNNAEGSQAVDNGSNNVFAHNYWSDWTGTGTYLIDGTTENQDSSPLTNPYHLLAPVITSPTHDSSTLSNNVTIQWTSSIDTFGHSLTYSLFYSTEEGINWTMLASGLTSTNYTFDTTTIVDRTNISFKIHTIDSVGFVTKSVSTETFLIVNSHQLSSPSGGIGVWILAFLLTVCSIAAGYYLVNTKFRAPSFIEYFQSDRIEFLKPIYHKVIVGLESIQTTILPESVVTPLLEEPTMPTSLVTWFPDDYRVELKTKLKGRTILTLIEIAFQYSEDANLTKLSQALDIPASTLSDELKKLIKLNYLDFHVTPQVLHDGRYRHYIITSKGISFLKILKSALELSIRRAKEKEQFI